MPEGGTEPAAGAADPGSTTQDPATQGGASPKPTASGVAPSRPGRQPSPQRPHHCPDCDKAFSYPSKLATHRLAHGGAQPHPCPHCPKAFGHCSKLAAHLWTHAPSRPYPCPDCSKSFCYPSKLAAHRHTHYATDARPYPCPHCPKAFSFPSKLAAHRLCHDPPAAPGSQALGCHRCSSCEEAFGQRHLLLLHQRGHHQAEGQGERVSRA